LGRLKSTVYARMEEMSFRSGAAVTGGVLAAAGVAIMLAVLLGGHGDAATSAPAPDVAVGSVAPPSSALASPSPSVSASAPPSITPRASRSTSPATAAGVYQPSSRVSTSATAQAAATPSPGRTTRGTLCARGGQPVTRAARVSPAPGAGPGVSRSVGPGACYGINSLAPGVIPQRAGYAPVSYSVSAPEPWIRYRLAG